MPGGVAAGRRMTAARARLAHASRRAPGAHRNEARVAPVAAIRRPGNGLFRRPRDKRYLPFTQVGGKAPRPSTGSHPQGANRGFIPCRCKDPLSNISFNK